jgi:AbrB family looped-hinge helix DNA binding protein
MMRGLLDSVIDKDFILDRVMQMSKITSKLQVTVPKALADRFRIRPGDEIEWQEAGDAIRVLPRHAQPLRLSTDRRLELFDRATERQQLRQAGRKTSRNAAGRGWTREELYERGRPD